MRSLFVAGSESEAELPSWSPGRRPRSCLRGGRRLGPAILGFPILFNASLIFTTAARGSLAALCMALHSIWSKPFIRRSGPIPFTTLAMAAGAAVLNMFSLLVGSFTPVEAFGPPQWLGVFYLGAFGSGPFSTCGPSRWSEPHRPPMRWRTW
jgi:drug/metabolite transporter (DMT)-like permease